MFFHRKSIWYDSFYDLACIIEPFKRESANFLNTGNCGEIVCGCRKLPVSFAVGLVDVRERRIIQSNVALSFDEYTYVYDNMVTNKNRKAKDEER